jgi:hypothetical protein
VLQQQGSQQAAVILATHIDAPDDLLRADVYQAPQIAVDVMKVLVQRYIPTS